MKKRTWVTLFPDLQQVHLNKDVGLIPKIMSKSYNYESKIVCVNSKEKIMSSDIEIIYLNGNVRIETAKYIIKNAKNIDVINLYHLSFLDTLFWVLPYKILNKYGKAYLKMDLSMKYVEDYTKNKLKLIMRKMLCGFYDVMSVESTCVKNYMNKYYQDRIICEPNGYYWNNNNSDTKTKEHYIIHVARMGTEDKNSELLVEAFIDTIYQHNWNLYLVGTMEKEFEQWLNDRIANNCDLKNRIEYVGNISDRDEMQSLYAKSSIVALSSKSESFGITLIEGLSMGCYIVSTTGVNPIYDIVKSNDIGQICVNDEVETMKDTLLKSITYLEANPDCTGRIKYAIENYDWKVICQDLNDKLFDSN